MIALLLLVVGSVIRNLAREEEMHFRSYEWRIKKGIHKLLIKEMCLKAVIMVVAIFGPPKQFWPGIICCILSALMMVYWFIRMPYVIAKYNHIVG